MGHSNPGFDYSMEQPDGASLMLQATKLERDLGVQMADTLKATAHCQAAARKASAAFWQLKMMFPTM